MVVQYMYQEMFEDTKGVIRSTKKWQYYKV